MGRGNRPRVKNGKNSNNLGMQSVIYGLDNNPKVTAADPKQSLYLKTNNYANSKVQVWRHRKDDEKNIPI